MVLLLAGCGALSRPAPEESEAEGTVAYDRAPPASAAMKPPPPSPEPMAGLLGRGGSSKKAAKMDRARHAGAATGVADGEATDDSGAEAPDLPARKRMVHYNGMLKLRVTRPTEALQQATEIGEASGGYVEALTATTVTLRVPVEKFRAVFAELTHIGDVVERSMTAHDVTDAYFATELRTKTLKASRDRLIALLGRAKTAREKLRLLSEIKRLTEQIDQLEMQLNTIASLASMSRLTVEVQPKQVTVDRPADEPIAAFRWIQRLSPFRRDVAQEGEKLDIDTPEGFVQLTDKEHFVAESADGAVIWSSTRKNRPTGDTAFWVEAIRTRLARAYGKAEVAPVGEMQVIRVVDPSEVAYRYGVAVQVVGDELHLVEIYYPTPDHEARYQAAVQAVLQGGAA